MLLMKTDPFHSIALICLYNFDNSCGQTQVIGFKLISENSQLFSSFKTET